MGEVENSELGNLQVAVTINLKPSIQSCFCDGARVDQPSGVRRDNTVRHVQGRER